jgi:hypothetical protein
MPWGVTDYYYQLLEVLEARGIKLIDTGGPDKDSRWVVDYCDSKLGSRSIIEQTRAFVPGFGAPPGYICRSYEEAIQLAHVLSRQTGHPIILKSDIGDGGKGVGLYNATSELVPIDLLINQELWEGVPIVVETAIGDGVDLSTPSIDAVIGRDGAITLMAIENMLTPERRCIGVEMGTSALPEVIYGRLEEFGTAVGKHMAMLGYRGWYDVDFLLGTQDHSLYASEINARRGGGTTPIEIAQRLFGPAWNQNHHFKSFERLYLSRPLDGYDKLRRVIETVNEQVGSEEAGVIELSSTSVLLKAPYLGYLIYAKTAEDVHTVEAYLQTQLPIRVEESVL